MKNFLSKNPSIIFIVASLVQYREILFANKMIGWDSLDAIFPHFLYMVDAFKNFSLPYYNPLIQGGFSFGENFFTAFLLNPIDIFLALISTVLSPLFIFQLQFPILAALSGYWIYRFFLRINNDQAYSILGGLCYSTGMLFPVAGQLPFFYAFVFLAFMIFPFPILAETKKKLSLAASLVFAVSFLIKSYYFFIPFFMLLSFFGLIKFYKMSPKKLVLLLGIVSLSYIVITFPILFYLKTSLSDLLGSFVSPEPRLRSLVPEQVFYNSSIISVMGDIIDNKIITGGAWTKGFNIGLVFLFFVQFSLLVTQKEKAKEKSALLFFMVFTMFVARGSFNSLHNALPLIKSFRWAFSYVYFSQIFYLLFIFLYPIKWEQVSKNQTKVVSIVTIVLSALMFWKTSNPKALYQIVIVLWLIYSFIKKPEWVIFGVWALTLYYTTKSFHFNNVPAHLEKPLVKNRELILQLNQNERLPSKFGDYVWHDRTWLYTKKPTMDGYNNSVHPIFWYLKGHEITKNIVIPLCMNGEYVIKDRKSYPENDNKYLEAYRDDLLQMVEKNKCLQTITTIDFKMDSLRFKTQSNHTLVLQNMSSFKLNSRGLEKNLPGGIRLISAPIGTEITFDFNKSLWVKVIAFNIFFLGVIILFGLQVSLNSFRKRSFV